MEMENLMRISTRCLAVVIGLSLASTTAHASGAGWEGGINRPGGDYTSSDLVADNPALCQSDAI